MIGAGRQRPAGGAGVPAAGPPDVWASRAPARGSWLTTAGLATVLAALYLPVLRELVGVWSDVTYYSYGFLVPVWSAWLVYTARARLRAPARHDRRGLIVVAGGLALLAGARLAESLTLAALSLPIVIGGLGWFALGRHGVRPLVFPVAFLAFMAPLPPGLVPVLSHHLQALATAFTTLVLTALGIPHARDGFLIALEPAIVHVSEACNGLRFLLTMAVLGVAFGWSTGREARTRLVVVAAALAVGLLANLARVSGTTLLVNAWGPEAASGLVHHVFGKSLYLVALGAFVLLILRLRR